MISTLRKLRLEAGLTQKEAAEKIGVNQSILSSWEHFRFCPSVTRVQRISQVYGCSVATIVGAVTEAEHGLRGLIDDGRRTKRRQGHEADHGTVYDQRQELQPLPRQ